MSEPTGNGYGKPFVFAPPKSPEEIARDEVRKTMPNLRYQCSRDPRLKRHVGAKWLFDRLSDDSFKVLAPLVLWDHLRLSPAGAIRPRVRQDHGQGKRRTGVRKSRLGP